MSGGHLETIKCPECKTVQEAEVEHTEPWWTHCHICEKCEYIIGESEWEKVELTNPQERGRDN